MSEVTSQQDQAYARIRDGIVSARYKPGGRLSMRSLTEELSIGRTPVREALVRLAQEQLVQTIPQSGTYVSLIDLDAAENARFVRESLETEIAGECSARIDRRGFVMMDEIMRKQEDAASRRDSLALFQNDSLFHRLLFIIAGRGEVWNWLEAMAVNLDRFRWLSILTEGLDWRDILDQHYQLCDAIVNHRPNEARYLASVHLHKMLADEKRVMERYPNYFRER